MIFTYRLKERLIAAARVAVRVLGSEDSVMTVLKRLAAAFSLSVIALCSVAVVSALAQRFPAAGIYDFAGSSASFETSPFDSSQPFIQISVTTENDTSMPQSQPKTTTTNDQLSYNYSFFDGTDYLYGNGCVVLNPSDFTLASNLQTATLATTITTDSATCGYQNGPLPLTIDVTWSASTPVLSVTSNDRFACAGYTKDSRQSNNGDGANATATISALTGSFAAQTASLSSHDQQITAQGAVPPDTCAQGIGRGAFGGFPTAGNYKQNVVEADALFFPTDPSQPLVFITLKRINATSSPLGGTPTTTAETDLEIFIQSDTINGSGCFVIDPAAFTVSSDLTSAVLNTTLTGQERACRPGNNLTSFPLSVDVTWSGPGPISTIGGDGQIACQQYHSVSSGSQMINGSPTATISLGAFTGTFSTEGALGTSVSRNQVAGVLAPGCGFH